MKVAQFTLPDSVYGIQFQAIQDGMKQCIRVLAKVDPVEAQIRYAKQQIVTEPADWAYTWWARFIRWCLLKKYLRKLVPYPLDALANAQYVTIGHEIFQFPAGVVDSIQAQIAEIYVKGDKPTGIIIGYEALHEVARTLDFNIRQNYAPDHGVTGTKLFNIPVFSTYKLKANQAIVI